MAYQDDGQLPSILLVLCILFPVSATSFPAIPECGEVKIAIETNKGYKCVCNRGENHFTISDGRTCGFRSGGCPLGEELQDDGECRACPQGTFKSSSGAGLCKKQTDCEMLGLETISYGDSSEDANCGSIQKTTLIKESHTTMANKQISYIAPNILPANRSPVMKQCGEGRIAKKTKDGYKCVCDREQNYFTVSDGRTCGFRSGGCPLGEELQDDGECSTCLQGTFKNISGEGLCKKQTDCGILDRETVSYGNYAEDAKCGSTLITDISRATEQSTIEPNNDEGLSLVIVIVLSIVSVVLLVLVFAVLIVWKRQTRRRKYCNDGMSDAMTGSQKAALEANQCDIVENMADVDTVLGGLGARGILTSGMVEIIKVKKTDSNKVRELLKVMPKRSGRAFYDFINVLKTSGNKELAERLESCYTNLGAQEMEGE